MIVRILGEGQFEVPNDAADTLNRLDGELSKAAEDGDHAAFGRTLTAILGAVRAHGRPVSRHHLGASDLVVPGPGATIADVRRLLSGGVMSA
jgi:hypothetical protein